MSHTPVVVEVPGADSPEEEAARASADRHLQALVERTRQPITDGELVPLEDLAREAVAPASVPFDVAEPPPAI